MDIERNIRTFECLKREGFANSAVVKALLVLNDLTQYSVAKDAGLKKYQLSQALGGHRKNPRAHAAISRSLGIPVRELFYEPKQKQEKP